MESIKKIPGTPTIAQDKHVGAVVREESRRQRNDRTGLVGLVNIGNSCYMNATLQALSNCPPFRQYLVDILHSHPRHNSQAVSTVLANLLRRMWSLESYPGHMSPRMVSSAMKQRMFKGTLQQDAQEFLRCLLSQIHEEVAIPVPPAEEWLQEPRGNMSRDTQRCRDSSASSCDSDTSGDSHSSQSRLVSSSPSFPRKKSGDSSPLPESQNSPSTRPKVLSKYIKINSSALPNSPDNHHESPQITKRSKELNCRVDSPCSSEAETRLQWSSCDVFEADLITKKVHLHKNYFENDRCLSGDTECAASQTSAVKESGSVCVQAATVEPADVHERLHGSSRGVYLQVKVGCEGRDASVSEPPQGEEKEEVEEEGSKRTSDQASPPVPCNKQSSVSSTSSIVSQVFEGILESRVKCLSCKVVSVTREPFQDLSLPIPGRKELEKFVYKEEDTADKVSEDSMQTQEGLSKKMCSIWNVFRSFFLDPPTNIYDCLHAFFDTSELKGDNRYYCSNCRSFQNSQKEMIITSLPEVLCVHLKRFKFDAYFSSKISRHISFPLSKLDMSQFLKTQENSGSQSCTYDLDAVITHYGGAGGGHYVTFAKNSQRNEWFEFNDTRVSPISADSVLGVEGYVLFYRRVPPNDSASLQTISMTSLLPPSGTTLPSPDVCYISRHWLHKLKHFTYPGPISQFDFACRHGFVHPTLKKEETHALALGIRKDVWERYHQLYRGGPFVQQLEVCRECQDMLGLLNERRKVEKDYIHKVQLEEKKAGAKVEHFMLPVAWIHRWQRFINSTSLDVKPPEAIDNTSLIQVVKLDDGTQGYKFFDGVPFRRVSQAAWLFFHKTYGGGPLVVSQLDSLHILTHV